MRVHLVPTSQRTLTQLALITTPKVPSGQHVCGPYSLLRPLEPTPAYTTRGGMPPRFRSNPFAR